MVKFNFSSVFLTLTAASTLVFALPTPDENTSNIQAETVSQGHFLFKGRQLSGSFKDGSNVVEVKGEGDVDVPTVTIKPANYTYNSIKDFRGPFFASVGPDDAFIVFTDYADVTINGRLDHSIGREFVVDGSFNED